MSSSNDPVTEILAAWMDGDPSARDRLVPIVYDELRRLAGGFFRRERDGHTLQPTALLHEALLRLFQQQPPRVQGREQFYGLIAQLMRRVLVDHARRRMADKRGGGVTRVTLGEASGALADNGFAVLDTEQALTRLERMDKRQARIVEMRVFAGFEVAEIASVLGVSESTVKREWRIARAWLHRELSPRG